MTREEIAYGVGSLLLSVGAGAIYWPCGLIAAGTAIVLPHLLAFSFRPDCGDNE